MKFFTLLAFASLSLPAFSQTCYVDLVDRYNRVLRSFTADGDPSTCLEGMKECRKTIRLEPHLGGVDCIRATAQSPSPRPRPTPIPVPAPNPYPSPAGYPHKLINGETVYNVSNSRMAIVVAQDFSGKFALRYLDNGLTGTGWDRHDLAPLRGCDLEVCVNDRIYNTSNSRYAVIAGLQMGGKFVLKYEDNGLHGSGWTRSDLALMKGCGADLCVGEKVYNVSNSRYATVAAIQSGNRYALRYHDNNLTGAGWGRSDLAIMKGCQSSLCVGSRVLNVSNRRYATIAALQVGNKFVLRYDDNGLSGAGWSLQDLAPLR